MTECQRSISLRYETECSELLNLSFAYLEIYAALLSLSFHTTVSSDTKMFRPRLQKNFIAMIFQETDKVMLEMLKRRL